VAVADNDDGIEELTPTGSHQSLGERVLPGTAVRPSYRLDSEVPDRGGETVRVEGVDAKAPAGRLSQERRQIEAVLPGARNARWLVVCVPPRAFTGRLSRTSHDQLAKNARLSVETLRHWMGWTTTNTCLQRGQSWRSKTQKA